MWTIITQALLRVVQSDLHYEDTTDMAGSVIFKNDLHLCSGENNTCQSEETSELGHTGLLYCLSSHKYISIIMTPCDSLFSLASIVMEIYSF